MKIVARLMLGVSALALAGCSQLPGSSLGATFGAERYLNADHGGPGFNGALAKEYTELGRRAAFTDVSWLNSTAYINKARQAEAGVTPAPWTPDQLGVNGDASALYQDVVAIIGANKDARPEACARAQAMWDQYLEALYGVPAKCILPEDAKKLLDEALAACAGGDVGVDYIVYFDWDSDRLTVRANETLDTAANEILAETVAAVSIVGHTDTSGSFAYNQGLSERRARNTANGLVSRGVSGGILQTAGFSESQPARVTADGVREPLNRRVEITLSD